MNKYHGNVNINMMVENVIQTKCRMVISVNVSTKIYQYIISAKNIIFRVLVHILVKLMNI